MKVNPSFKKVSISACWAAGDIIRKNFGKKIGIKEKRDLTLVTETDLEADRIIATIIKRNFPDHNIVSEESGGKMATKGYNWVIDPLDGTTNYISDFPFFSVSMALLEGMVPILGVVFNPINKDLYCAQRGEGAYLNGKRIRVNRVENLRKVNLGFSKGKDLAGGIKTLAKLIPFIRTFRYLGSDNLAICQLAAGRIDGFMVRRSAYYDVAAGVLIAQEAGAIATDFNNKQYKYGSLNLVVGNKKIHSKLLKLIR